MLNLVPSKKFLKDIEKFKTMPKLRKKISKTLSFFEDNPMHPGLNIERIVNDHMAWSARIDKHYRISFEPETFLESGIPDWSSNIILLRMLDHDDLYKYPR
jgi:mRNA-degrading endonuclease RelE of RelBE toxin-antitoxin system